MRVIRTDVRWVLAISIALVIYIAAASSFPASIIMWQAYDDALYIRLGSHIANGQWLGPYNELTLVRAPMYPIFLAATSTLGIPFNVAQYCVYFGSALYLANVISRVRSSALLGVLLFGALLVCPSYYVITRVLREPLYTALTLLLIGCWIELFMMEHSKRSRALLATAVGLLSGIYWLTREEGVWILPSLATIAVGGLAFSKPGGLRTRILDVTLGTGIVALFAATTIASVGFINRIAYDRFVLVEMNDRDFQRAIAALQRAGAPYQRHYLPVPRAARQLVYAESPSFAKLKPFLDPEGKSTPWTTANCTSLPDTCGDIAGGWFMFALREAAGKAGMHESPRTAAHFYRALAIEVEGACESGRLACYGSLPAFVPTGQVWLLIPRSQWQALPGIVLTALQLVVYVPPPPQRVSTPPMAPSDLNSPDAGEAIEFLNRPFHFVRGERNPPQTRSRVWLRESSLEVLENAVKLYQLMAMLGIISLLLCLMLSPRKTMTSHTFLIIVAVGAAVLTRCVLLALSDISSFPAVYHDRMSPAGPLVAVCSMLAIHLLISLLYHTLKGKVSGSLTPNWMGGAAASKM